jgi:hypothetical protein
LDLPLFDRSNLVFLKYFDLLFLGLSAIGFMTPVSTAAAFALSFYGFGFMQNFGYFHHADAPFVIALLIFATSPAGADYSVDRFLSGKIKWWPFARNPVVPKDCGWTFQLIRVLWVHVFFSAGLLKVILKGGEWLENNMLWIFLFRNEPIYKEMTQSTHLVSEPFRNFLILNPFVTQVLNWITIVIEFAMPLVLFSRRAVSILVPCGIFMMLGIYLSMGHQFLPRMLPLSLAWLPYDRIDRRIRSASKRNS